MFFKYILNKSPRRMIFALIKLGAIAFTEIGAERFVEIVTEHELPVEIETLLRHFAEITDNVVDDDFWEAVDAVRADPNGLDADPVDVGTDQG